MVFFFSSSFSDSSDHCVPGSHVHRAIGQPDRDLRGGQARADAHFPEPVHRQPGRFRHDAVPGVHAVHAHIDTATPVDHGHGVLQIGATVAGHQHHGVGGHDHGDRHRPILGDSPRVRAKRTAHRVRVHSHRVVTGRLDHVSRSLLPGDHYNI